MEERRWKRTETATLTNGYAGDAVAAAASEKAPHAVVVKDFELSEVLSTHRPCIGTVEQNHPDQGLVYAALGLDNGYRFLCKIRKLWVVTL